MWHRPRQVQLAMLRLYGRSFMLCIAALVVAAAGLIYAKELKGWQESTVGELKPLHHSEVGFDAFEEGDGGGRGRNSRRRVSNPPLEANILLLPTSNPLIAHEAREDEYNRQLQGLEEKEGLPHCYSSAEASPSEGVWRRCEGGINESIASVEHWDNQGIGMDWFQSCQTRWDKEHPNEGPMPYWKWEPERCSLRAVTAPKICHVMEGRKGILLVGDSLTHLSSTTLASIANAQRTLKGFWKEVWSACEGKLKITYIRDDYLYFGTPRFRVDGRFEECNYANGTRTENARCLFLANERVVREADVLVVNSGAHKKVAAQYSSEMMAASDLLASWMRKEHGNSSILVVRNTVPGHAGCNERMFDGPVDIEVAAKLAAAGPKNYHWETFGSKNAMLEKAFSAEKGWKLMDAYTPTVLRADMHHGGEDCLHYCMPGPADHWITMLYNIILVATGKDEEE